MFAVPIEDGKKPSNTVEEPVVSSISAVNPTPTPVIASPPNGQFESMFGEFPQDQEYLPEHMMSDSSAEDDMTLGPDPDSIDQSLLAAPLPHPDALPSASLDPNASQSTQMSGITIPMPESQGMEIDSSIILPSNISALGVQPLMMQPNGSLSPSAAHPGTITIPSPQGMHSFGYRPGLPSDNFDLPEPSMRIKRNGPDSGRSSEAGMREYDPIGASGSAKKARRTSSTPQRSSLPLPTLGTPNTQNTTTNGEGTPAAAPRGYFYRNRDKTNYNQAHKGTLPSPPLTPESSKRIRCTWNLDETRLLYDLLKDTTIEEFPDAQHIRAFLIKADPACTKTLDHVRNKKANLIQKAHSKNVSVGEILISDMHKLEMELLGSSSSSRRDSSSHHSSHSSSSHGGGGGGHSDRSGHHHSSSRDSSSGAHHYQGGLSMHREPLSVSGSRSGSVSGQNMDQKSSSAIPASERVDSPASGTRSSTSALMQSNGAAGLHGSSERSGNGTNFGSSGPSDSQLQSHLQGSPTITLSATVLSRNIPGTKTSSRPSRRRVAKRGPPTLLSTMNQATTSTAQQLAKVASQSGTASTTALATTALSGGLLPTSAGSLVPGAIISSNGSDMVSRSGPNAIGGNPVSLESRFDMMGSSSSLFKPPSPSLIDVQRWQQWVLEEVSKLVAGQNEIRTQLRLLPIEMNPPPASIASSQANKLPASSQWITTTWPHADSLDSEETESASEDHSSSAPAFPSASNTSTHSPTQW